MSNMVQKKNAFVKREQEGMLKMMGDRPGAPAEMKRFNAFMSNNGEVAQKFARELTAGIDHKAFPVD